MRGWKIEVAAIRWQVAAEQVAAGSAQTRDTHGPQAAASVGKL